MVIRNVALFSPQVSIENASFLETAHALIVNPRCEAGKYYPLEPDGDVNYPWGIHFNQ